jgi:hypothetical protein
VAQGTASTGHSGFHAAVGLGYGSASVTCDGCDNSRESSVAVLLRFGGAVKPGVVLSGEINGWSKELNGATTTFSWLNFVAQFYPQSTEGFYVKAGVGFGGLRATGFASGLGSLKLETTNFGLIAGVGYDVPLTRSFSLTPYADFLFAAAADEKLNGGSTGVSLGANLIHVGLAASWR